MNLGDLNWFDLAIMGTLAVSVVVSLFRGFIAEVFSLAVWLIALWVAFTFSGQFTDYIPAGVDTPSIRSAIAFTGLFVTVLVIGGLLNYLLARLVESTGLSATDRLMGALFGLIRGVAIVLVFFLVAGLTPIPKDPWWQEARLSSYFEQMAMKIKHYLPETIAEQIDYSEATPIEKAADLLMTVPEKLKET